MDDYNIWLAQHRLKLAKEALNDAKMNLSVGSFKNSVNRSYYAIFYAMRSVLALQNKDFKKHSAVISHFNQHYINTNKFPNDLYKIISTAFRVRQSSDYDDFYVVSVEEAENQINNANRLINLVSEFLENLN